MNRVRSSIRFLKYGIFMMAVGLIVPALLSVFEASAEEPFWAGALMGAWYLFSALFFVGLVLVILSAILAARARQEPATTADEQSDLHQSTEDWMKLNEERLQGSRLRPRGPEARDRTPRAGE